SARRRLAVEEPLRDLGEAVQGIVVVGSRVRKWIGRALRVPLLVIGELAELVLRTVELAEPRERPSKARESVWASLLGAVAEAVEDVGDGVADGGGLEAAAGVVGEGRREAVSVGDRDGAAVGRK